MSAPITFIQIAPDADPVLKTEPLPYERLVEVVGYPVEAKVLGRGAAYMYMCEEGKQQGLPVNHVATRLIRSIISPDDFVVGTVVIVGPPDINGEDTSVSDEWWAHVQSRAKKA